ncbi:MAG: extracellular solute-binding protein [Calditrichia bacterium]
MKDSGSHSQHSKLNSGSFAARYNLAIVMFMVAIFLSLIFYLLPFSITGSKREIRKIYFADNITPAHKEIIEHFNQKYRGKIEVVAVDLPFSKFTTNERKELIARALRNSNSRIDIFTVDQIWVPRFAKWAEPLSRYFARREIGRILPAALSTCYQEDILVGVPLHIDIGVLYYRKDLLQNLPNPAALERRLKSSMTWDDFIGLKKSAPSDYPFYVFQAENYEGLTLHLMEVCGESLSDFISGNKIHLNNPSLIRACQLLVNLVNEASCSPAGVLGFNESASYSYALAQDALFLRGWPGLLREAADYPYGKEKADLLGIAALPHLTGREPASAFGGWNLMVSRHSHNKEEAVLFLKYVLSDEAQKTLYETAGFLPILKSIYADSSYIAAHSHLSDFGSLLERGIFRPAHPEYTKISNVLSYYIHRALERQISPEEALSLSEKEINGKILAGHSD